MPDDQHLYVPQKSFVTLHNNLADLIRTKSFFYGETITLASGKTSNFYFNTKPTMLHPNGAHAIATLMLEATADLEFDFIGGLEMGAVPIASSITAISYLQGRPVRAFFVRKQAKEHGTKGLVEGLQKDESLRGQRVVVVEDVTTTGQSALKAVNILREAGAEVLRVVTVIDRQEGAAEFFADHKLEFTALFGAQTFLARV